MPRSRAPTTRRPFDRAHGCAGLNRDAVCRILKAEGLGRLSPVDRSRRSHSSFKEYDLGFVHVDVKHLPKLRTSNAESRKRYLYVAIDRASRFVHLAVKTTRPSAVRSPSSKRPSRPSPSGSAMC